MSSEPAQLPAPVENPAPPAATPNDAAPPKKLTWWDRISAYRHEHETSEMCIFFVGGFAFDVATMDRIDNWQTLAQQAVYLLILGGLLLMDQRFVNHIGEPPPWLVKVWDYSEAAIHFFFGSLRPRSRCSISRALPE